MLTVSRREFLIGAGAAAVVGPALTLPRLWLSIDKPPVDYRLVPPLSVVRFQQWVLDDDPQAATKVRAANPRCKVYFYDGPNVDGDDALGVSPPRGKDLAWYIDYFTRYARRYVEGFHLDGYFWDGPDVKKPRAQTLRLVAAMKAVLPGIPIMTNATGQSPLWGPDPFLSLVNGTNLEITQDNPVEQWQWVRDQMRTVQDKGKMFLLTNSTTNRPQTLAYYALHMLFATRPDCYAELTWRAQYTPMRPLGPAQQTGSLWSRRFTNGAVVSIDFATGAVQAPGIKTLW